MGAGNYLDRPALVRGQPRPDLFGRCHIRCGVPASHGQKGALLERRTIEAADASYQERGAAAEKLRHVDTA